MRRYYEFKYSEEILKQLKQEDFSLTYDMCNKNDYADCKVRLLVDEENLQPLAVVIYKDLENGKLHIYSFEVHREYHLSNIGRTTLTEFKKFFTYIELSTLNESKLFYEKLGFNEEGENRMVWRKEK